MQPSNAMVLKAHRKYRHLKILWQIAFLRILPKSRFEPLRKSRTQLRPSSLRNLLVQERVFMNTWKELGFSVMQAHGYFDTFFDTLI
jgi:hypothetical protein